MRRLPIRLRVAAAFAAAMALVLAGTGLFVYARLGGDLSHALDQDLRLRAQDLSALVRSGHGSLARDGGSRLVERGESFAQLVGPDGRVLDATPPLGRRSLLRPGELHAALRRSRFVDVPCGPHVPSSVRPHAAASEKQWSSSSSPWVTISISMSETSSAMPRETLPVSTTSWTVAGSASAIACAIERRASLRSDVVTSGQINRSRAAYSTRCANTQTCPSGSLNERLSARIRIPPTSSNDNFPISTVPLTRL